MFCVNFLHFSSTKIYNISSLFFFLSKTSVQKITYKTKLFPRSFTKAVSHSITSFFSISFSPVLTSDDPFAYKWEEKRAICQSQSISPIFQSLDLMGTNLLASNVWNTPLGCFCDEVLCESLYSSNLTLYTTNQDFLT